MNIYQDYFVARRVLTFFVTIAMTGKQNVNAMCEQKHGGNVVKHAPLLAAPADLTKIVYPVLTSPKLDGIRCIVVGGQPLSRKLKIIPNKYIQKVFKECGQDLEGLDGELVVGSPVGKGVFQRTSSGVMSHEGSPSFKFFVIDKQAPGSFEHRCNLHDLPEVPWLRIVQQTLVRDEKSLLKAEEAALRAGYEGLIIRSPHGLYKHGRSTVKEGILLKLVRYGTEEATIIDFKEQMHNDNTRGTDNLGYSKRSSAKAGKKPVGKLGAFVCESENYRKVFDVGTGFTSAQRVNYWVRRKNLRGKLIRFRHKPIGAVDAPRHPVFTGFRSTIDL